MDDNSQSDIDSIISGGDDTSPEVVRFRRERPPSDYLLRIKSFYEMATTLGVFESTKFLAHGYTWVLVIYPNGNMNDDGEDYLSMYLRLVDGPHSNVLLTCTFKFFIYDHKHDNYLVIQTIPERRFHALKNEWGVSRALTLATLNDHSRGFLKDDCCILGAEVSIIHFGAIKTADFSNNMLTISSSYTWELNNFSSIAGEDFYYSSPFSVGNYLWKLLICPKGDRSNRGKSLSLYLNLADSEKLSSEQKLLANFELCINDHRNIRYQSFPSTVWFCSTNKAWGITNFLPLSELHNPESGFIFDDVLIVELNMRSLFLLSN